MIDFRRLGKALAVVIAIMCVVVAVIAFISWLLTFSPLFGSTAVVVGIVGVFTWMAYQILD